MNIESREIRLKSRPAGMPTAENFDLATVSVPTPEQGEVRVRNRYMSVDPYMRGRMRDAKSYVPPFQIGEPLTGGAVGEVIDSQHPDFAPGDYVLHMQGWREAFVSGGDHLSKIDPSLAPIQSYLGVMGMPGMTAYVGLLHIAEAKAGETVFVSAAAGAVGSVVCQIAKAKGCRVVGSAGSDEKIEWLKQTVGIDEGIDEGINYKTTPHLTKALAAACPDGIDVYFENVGGEHLEAALSVMNNYGRVAVCGMIALYNATEPVPAPRNLSTIIGKRLRLQGFIVSDHSDVQAQFRQEMASWLKEGTIQSEETVVEGIENAPDAFMGLFEGENLGKMLVKI